MRDLRIFDLEKKSFSVKGIILKNFQDWPHGREHIDRLYYYPEERTGAKRKQL